MTERKLVSREEVANFDKITLKTNGHNKQNQLSQRQD